MNIPNVSNLKLSTAVLIISASVAVIVPINVCIFSKPKKIYAKNPSSGTQNVEVVNDENPSMETQIVEVVNDENQSVETQIIETQFNGTIPEEWEKTIYWYESGLSNGRIGDTSAVSRSGNFVGICQMGNLALQDENYNGSIAKFLQEPYEIQSKYCQKRFKHITKILESQEMEVTLLNMYILHQQGYTGGISILNGDNIEKYKFSMVNNIDPEKTKNLYIEKTGKRDIVWNGDINNKFKLAKKLSREIDSDSIRNLYIDYTSEKMREYNKMIEEMK